MIRFLFLICVAFSLVVSDTVYYTSFNGQFWTVNGLLNDANTNTTWSWRDGPLKNHYRGEIGNGSCGKSITAIVSPSIPISKAGSLEVTFYHDYYFSSQTDGGLFFYRVNSGEWKHVEDFSLWNDVPNCVLEGNSPFTGKSAFCVEGKRSLTRALPIELKSAASVQFAFGLATASCNSFGFWNIYDFQVDFTPSNTTSGTCTIVNSNTLTDTFQDNFVCCFAFQNPTAPTFVLPSSNNGDITLNSGNPIVMFNGTSLAQGCNGQAFYYKADNGLYTDIYSGTDGNVRNSIDVFYATGNSVKRRTIQSWQSNLPSLLNGRNGLLFITCNNGLSSCVRFNTATAGSV